MIPWYMEFKSKMTLNAICIVQIGSERQQWYSNRNDTAFHPYHSNVFDKRATVVCWVRRQRYSNRRWCGIAFASFKWAEKRGTVVSPVTEKRLNLGMQQRKYCPRIAWLGRELGVWGTNSKEFRRFTMQISVLGLSRLRFGVYGQRKIRPLETSYGTLCYIRSLICI